MRETCIACGEKFTKFGYEASTDPLCFKCREKLEEEQQDSRTQRRGWTHPLSFLFGDDMW